MHKESSEELSVKKPEYLDYEEYNNRLRKLEELKALGINPYPHEYKQSHTSEDLRIKYQDPSSLGHSDEAGAGTTPLAKVAGRLVLFRAMGKNIFAQLQDEEGRIQVMFNRDLTKVDGYEPSDLSDAPSHIKVIEKKFDLGDIIGVEGHLFFTQKGELTLFAKKVTLLCKTLLPLPEKHSGLHDKELRYRKRWLDLISNPEVKEAFKKRSEILRIIRKYCEDIGFMEVETPIVQSVYGGAEAKPFMTKLNALNQDMFLRISLEIPLKKLIIGGFPKVYEIGKCFRNEGLSRKHNPEFTLLEAYASYWDYHDMMDFVERLYEKIALTLFGSTRFKVNRFDTGEEMEIDVKAPWVRLSMKDSIKKYAHIDVDAKSDEELKKILLDSGHFEEAKLKTLSRGLLIAGVFEVFVEPSLLQPHHIIDHPVETTVLCKLHRDKELCQEGLIERFESFLLGGEICNAYSELNDPVLQRTLLDGQQQRRDAGDEEAAPLDEEFLEAIAQGMPPAAGVGIGIDRLVMLFTNAHSIRDVLFFPLMKPQ